MGGCELRGTGAHLGEAELFVWTRFLDAARLVEELVARHLADHHGMTTSDYEVLVRLDGAGGTMRLTLLAERCVSSKSKLTHTMNRLEGRGWIVRRPAADDRRGREAVLTDVGADVLAAASGGHAELIREHLLLRLSRDERAVIGAAMDRISIHLRQRREVGG